ncbi:MAG: cytochrome-c peroxidase, partial [Saprospiraceae bacterium]|nr:cytochrome-c peroxidase [Saprospiraceae bacterium]MCB0684501.1 cytochrome-c peroxidase [Saprospiraceae bacterium]
MEFKQLLKMPLLALLALGLVMVSCKKDDDTSTDDLDQELEAVLLNASGGQGLSFFVLPESDDFASIPQDPNNPLTTAKVALGKLLYHETGMGLSPMHAESEGTFSCA